MGPDQFPVEFYQRFWLVTKGDFMSMFARLYNGDLSLYKLNFGVITLLHKKKEVVRASEGFVVLHETIHELHSKKLMELSLRWILKKAYDKLKWQLFQQCLRIKGFPANWCQLTHLSQGQH